MSVKDNHISYQMRLIEGKEARVKRIIIKGIQKQTNMLFVVKLELNREIYLIEMILFVHNENYHN
jgi:hypothetical protein